MSSLHLVHAAAYQAAIPAKHRFPMGKYGEIISLVQSRDWAKESHISKAVPATTQQAGLAHDPNYVARLANLQLTAQETKAIGLPQNKSVAARAFASAGGSLTACRLALTHGITGSLAGGSHHAGPQGGRGFCALNDVGVALSVLLAEDRINGAVVIDLDVHQGDGTAEIFASDPRVFTASLHCEDNYPFTKAQSDLDLGLATGTGDSGYLPALDRLLETAEPAARRGDLIVFNAGVDPHAEDHLGRLALSDPGLAARDAMVFEWAKSLGKPLCLVLGGGYDKDIGRVAERHAQVFDRLFAASLRL